MAEKIKRFDAIAASRQWRRATGKVLSRMTPDDQIAYLNRHLKECSTAPAKKPASANR